MSERLGIKLRRLPDGPFQEAFEVGLTGRLLEVDLAGSDLPMGALLEIERGTMLCFGELRQKTSSTAVVLIEHALDRTRLKPIQEAWG
jgi:hypothetical protein